jgi:hypothetical protein
MNIGTQDPVRELDHCIAQVDDGMTRKRFDIAPLRISSRRKNLEATKPVEKDSDTAKVGVLSECNAPVIDGLWRRFDESNLVPACAMQSVETGQCARG